MIIVGTDYTDETLDLVESGEVQAFVAQPLYEEAQTSVIALDTLLRSNSYPFFTSLDAPLVTRANMDATASSCRTSTTGTHKKIPEDNGPALFALIQVGKVDVKRQRKPCAKRAKLRGIRRKDARRRSEQQTVGLILRKGQIGGTLRFLDGERAVAADQQPPQNAFQHQLALRIYAPLRRLSSRHACKKRSGRSRFRRVVCPFVTYSAAS